MMLAGKMNQAKPMKLWIKKLFSGVMPSMTGERLMSALTMLGIHRITRGMKRRTRIFECWVFFISVSVSENRFIVYTSLCG